MILHSCLEIKLQLARRGKVGGGAISSKHHILIVFIAATLCQDFTEGYVQKHVAAPVSLK